MTFTGDWYSDNLIMTSILDTVDFYSGTERKKMLKVPERIGGSMLYGVTWRGYLSPNKKRTHDPETGLYRTKIYDIRPDLKNIFREFADYHFPDFEWFQVQMNKNFPCPPHKDSTNVSESILCCFGDYEGGLTCIEKKGEVVKVDGAKYLHWVEPIKSGTRYSLVFYSNTSVKKKILNNNKDAERCL